MNVFIIRRNTDIKKYEIFNEKLISLNLSAFFKIVIKKNEIINIEKIVGMYFLIFFHL